MSETALSYRTRPDGVIECFEGELRTGIEIVPTFVVTLDGITYTGPHGGKYTLDAAKAAAEKLNAARMAKIAGPQDGDK